ncbi:MAG: response regulator [Candidatus Manganitrophus sp.]|nr:response regulator [Candidatus Manganitrophus sp.]
MNLVLMDIMMPELDGYETTRMIRNMGGKYKSLPIIALTAKAMKEDREKCIEAGVSDYITKPVDNNRLLSLLRIWMDRKEEGKETIKIGLGITSFKKGGGGRVRNTDGKGKYLIGR